MSNVSNLFTLDKQPDEKLVITIDYSKLDFCKQTGVALSTVAVTAVDSDDSNCTSVLITGSDVDSTTSKAINFGIKGGTSGEKYHCKVLSTFNVALPDSSNYVTLEADVYVTVRDK